MWTDAPLKDHTGIEPKIVKMVSIFRESRDSDMAKKKRPDIERIITEFKQNILEYIFMSHETTAP